MYNSKNLLCDDAKIWIPYYDSFSIASSNPTIKTEFKITRVDNVAEFMQNLLFKSTADVETRVLLQECADKFVNDPPVEGFVLFEYVFTESIKVAENVEGSLL